MDNKFSIETYESLLLKTASDLVRIESINPPGNEENASTYLLDFFKAYSIEAETYMVEGNRRNVVAHIPGKDSSRSIAFTGHMDVVPVSPKEALRWTSPPFSGELSGGFLHGRGSSDMKGGLASAMVSMASIKESGITPPRDIYMIATVDEEDGMKGSKSLLDEKFLDRAELIIVCEPTGLMVCTAGKGRTYGTISIQGGTGHGSQGKGQNAIDLARKLMNLMVEEDFAGYEDTEYGSSFWQPLSIQAGVEPCVVPDELQLKIDARLVPYHDPDDIWRRLDSIIERLKLKNPSYEVSYDVIDMREGWIVPEGSENLQLVKNVYLEAGIQFNTTFFAGTTDGSIFRRRGIECLILGPGNLSLVHMENEKVKISELLKSMKIYTIMMLSE
ncbi:M20 family metallopeptidase [Youngiibacter multivorans]|uniref:Acetylornithine deacetylase/succinyl-diaminopimelate desuccinylase family protein n=1 Tax=Youngiibacter multivorans TaxID=937251 RepID=A0ABS4G3V1_9CLOT|nr:M20 family metallopeptidase [Youngiibacter multivorans]MBP1919211.1 acetylornithine deacetylase/succinyl-diaminopimelate desuccinylase family protein [Youngiibacter multivorans]